MGNISYGFVRHLPGVTFDQAVARTTEALQSEGFGILSEIDVSATLKKKLNADFRRYSILGACNPHLAHRALMGEEQIGLLLPCNVVVQDSEGGSTVSIADPKAMFTMVNNDAIGEVAVEAETRLRRALEQI